MKRGRDGDAGEGATLGRHLVVVMGVVRVTFHASTKLTRRRLSARDDFEGVEPHVGEEAVGRGRVAGVEEALDPEPSLAVEEPCALPGEIGSNDASVISCAARSTCSLTRAMRSAPHSAHSPEPLPYEVPSEWATKPQAASSRARCSSARAPAFELGNDPRSS